MLLVLMMLVLEKVVIVGEAGTGVAVGVENSSKSVDDLGGGADRDGDVNGGDNNRGGESDDGVLKHSLCGRFVEGAAYKKH